MAVEGTTPIEIKFNVSGLDIETVEKEAQRRAEMFFKEEPYRLQLDVHEDPTQQYPAYVAHCRAWRPRDYSSEC